MLRAALIAMLALAPVIALAQPMPITPSAGGTGQPVSVPAASISGTIPSTQPNSPFALEINLNDPAYGATGNDTADDTVAINAALTAVRSAIAALPTPGSAVTGGVHITCKSGSVFKLTGSINGTGINTYPQLVPVVFDLAGCAFDVAFSAGNAGKSVFDFMGDSYLAINDLTIWVSTLTNLPSTGIQVGRVTCSAPGTCTPAYHHKINRPVIRGRYTVAAAYLRSSELTTITDPDIVNNYITSGYGIAFDGANHLGASIVTAATDQAAIDTAIPQNDDVVRGGHVSAAASAPFFVANIYRLTLDGTYGLSQNPSTPTECLRLYAGVGEIDLLDARLHCEPNLALTTLPNSIVVEGSLSNPTPTLKGIKLEDQFAFATSSLIGLDASVTSGTIYDLVVKVPNFNTGAAKVFTTADAGNLTLIDPIVEVPATGNWTRSATQWGGRICAGSTATPCSLGTSGFTTNSGAGKVIVGDVGAGGGYAGINLSGTSAAGDYNFISAGGDQDLYINRHTGRQIHIRENGGTDQVTIATGGNVTATGSVNAQGGLQSNGTAVIPPSQQILTAGSGTINKATNATYIRLEGWGPGGGGGNGPSLGASTSGSGGGGGGGGGHFWAGPMSWSQLGVTSCTYVVGTGGVHGGGTAATDTTVTCGSFVWHAYHGGAGSNGTASTASAGGGGAGVIGAGGDASAGTGGTAAVNGSAGGSGISAAASNSGQGTGGGGDGATGTAGAGGSAAMSATGGGAGGGCNGASAVGGANGGSNELGGSAGAGANGKSPVVSSGTGAAGASGSTGAAGSPGVAGIPGGGGAGGGAGCNNTGTPSNGSDGADGRLIVVQQ